MAWSTYAPTVLLLVCMSTVCHASSSRTLTACSDGVYCDCCCDHDGERSCCDCVTFVWKSILGSMIAVALIGVLLLSLCCCLCPGCPGHKRRHPGHTHRRESRATMHSSRAGVNAPLFYISTHRPSYPPPGAYPYPGEINHQNAPIPPDAFPEKSASPNPSNIPEYPPNYTLYPSHDSRQPGNKDPPPAYSNPGYEDGLREDDTTATASGNSATEPTNA